MSHLLLVVIDVQAFVTFLAIVTHIWAEAFTLSTAMLKARVSVTNTVKAMLGFSCITPAAVFLGMGLGQLLEGLAPQALPLHFVLGRLSLFVLSCVCVCGRACLTACVARADI